jgi:photosystem II stability/assembly factor-like uncharacterized protein
MVFSDDAGKTWQWHDLPLDSGGVLRLEYADPLTALAVAASGLYISHDAGKSWQKAQAGLPHAPVGDLFVGPGMWLVSVEPGGLYLSRDRGASWIRVKNYAPFNESIEAAPFQALVAAEGSGFIVVGSATEGLFVLNLAEPPAVAISRESGK